MDIKLKIKFDDGKILEISEEKAKELYYKLKQLYDQPIWINPVPHCPDPWWTHPIITYGDDSATWKPMHPEVTCESNSYSAFFDEGIIT